MGNHIDVYKYTIGEEIASSVIHGIGTLLAITGLGVLTVYASILGDAWHITSCSIFGATLVILYTASTLYHSIQLPKAKNILRIIDHSAIFLLIAGTYTPFLLVNLRGPWGWSLFGVIWGVAVFGIAFQHILIKKWRMLSVILYVAMGWTVVVAIRPLISSLETGGLVLLVLGGVIYSLGLIFYGWRKMPYSHAIWHVFVLAGSILHFFAILIYVIPISANA